MTSMCALIFALLVIGWVSLCVCGAHFYECCQLVLYLWEWCESVSLCQWICESQLRFVNFIRFCNVVRARMHSCYVSYVYLSIAHSPSLRTSCHYSVSLHSLFVNYTAYASARFSMMAKICLENHSHAFHLLYIILHWWFSFLYLCAAMFRRQLPRSNHGTAPPSLQTVVATHSRCYLSFPCF